MKKLVATVLTLLTCGAAYALPVGNPSDASLYDQGMWVGTACIDPCDPCFCWFDAWGLKMGFYGDYVFNRNLEVDRAEHSDDIERATMFTNAGYLAINLCNRIDIFGTLGTTKLSIRSTEKPFQPGPTVGPDIYELHYDTTFSWSAGARGTLLSWRCFSIGVEGQWFETCPDLSSIQSIRVGETLYFEDIKSHYCEWQAGLGLSYTVSTQCPSLAFVPYVAATWSGAKWKMGELLTTVDTRDFELVDLKTQKLWGMAVGATFTMSDMIGVTVEGRFGDEQAIHVNSQFKF